MADHDEVLFQELANNYDAEERQAGVPPREPDRGCRRATPGTSCDGGHPCTSCMMSPPTHLLPVGVEAVKRQRWMQGGHGRGGNFYATNINIYYNQ